MHNGA
ncbi:hypothetical protein YPPY36_0516, partial [Yersinia pestis PY-36]